MIDEFISRMEEMGIQVVKTHFFLRSFYLKRGFSVDKRWGVLVKILSAEDNGNEYEEGKKK